MADGVDVTLCVPLVHQHAVEDIYSNGNWRDWDELHIETTKATLPSDYVCALACFGFQAVPDGNLLHLDKLQHLGIAYTSSWSRGSFIDPGEKHLRFTESGEAELKSLTDRNLFLSIDSLLCHFDNAEALKDYIRKAHYARVVLPWVNQEEYGQRYRTRQLITPKG